MKAILTISLSFLVSQLSFSQIRIRDYQAGRNFYLYNILNGSKPLITVVDSRTSILLGPTSYLDGLSNYSISTSLDTNRITTIKADSFASGSSFACKDNHYYFVRQKPNPNFPTTTYPGGNFSIAKYNEFGRKIWDWNITPPGVTGEDLFSSSILESTTDSSDLIWVLTNRIYTPNGNGVVHPVILLYDTSGVMVQEFDVSVSGLTLGDQIFQIDNQSFGVIGREIGQRTSEAVFWHFRKSPIQLISKRYLGITAERNAREKENTLKFAIGPASKFFLYGTYFQRDTSGWFTYESSLGEMRDSATGAARWNINGNDKINYADFLQDGSLFCQIVTDTGIYLRWYDSNTGNLIQNNFYGLPDSAYLMSGINAFFPPAITDSGHFFSGATLRSVVSYNNIVRIYCLPNVGKVWKPWNNPTGLPNSKPSLSLHAYPNPTSGKFKLRGYKEKEGLTHRLFSNSGKEVLRGIPSPEGEIDISQLSPGLYHLEALTTSGKRWSTRVVRE